MLTLHVSIPDGERKINKIINFNFLCGASKGFMKAFKAFEAPQRNLEIKI